MGYGCIYRWVSQHGVIAEVAAVLVAAVAPAAEPVAVVVAEPVAAAVVPLAAKLLVVLLAAAVRPYDARSRASMFLLSVSFNRFLT